LRYLKKIPIIGGTKHVSEQTLRKKPRQLEEEAAMVVRMFQLARKLGNDELAAEYEAQCLYTQAIRDSN
jgi:hypothetical protein